MVKMPTEKSRKAFQPARLVMKCVLMCIVVIHNWQNVRQLGGMLGVGGWDIFLKKKKKKKTSTPCTPQQASFLFLFSGAPVAQWVKDWSTDLAVPVPGSHPARGEIFPTVNGT